VSQQKVLAYNVVMPGLVPGIHVLTALQQEKRGWPGHLGETR
jgi:hypothetical protein